MSTTLELRPKVDKATQDSRLSLQVNYRSPEGPGRGGSGRSRPTSTVSVINEDEILDTSKPNRFERNNSTGTRQKEVNPYRKSSKADAASRPNSGIINGGFVDSRPPSIYGGSVNSLPVIREQYWSCSRRSKFERTLFAAVGILVGVIIVLATIVGVLAASRKEKFGLFNSGG